MINVIKIVLFLLVNVAGYYTIPVMFWMAVIAGFFTPLPTGLALTSLQMLLFGIGTWVWIAAALVSVGYFFVPVRNIRTWLIFAPMYCPAIYGAGALVYYRYFAAV